MKFLNTFKKAWKDTRGASVIDKIIGIVISAVIIAALIPTAMTALLETNTTGWGASSIALWGVMPILIIVGCVVAIVGFAMKLKGA